MAPYGAKNCRQTESVKPSVCFSFLIRQPSCQSRFNRHVVRDRLGVSKSGCFKNTNTRIEIGQCGYLNFFYNRKSGWASKIWFFGVFSGIGSGRLQFLAPYGATAWQARLSRCGSQRIRGSAPTKRNQPSGPKCSGSVAPLLRVLLHLKCLPDNDVADVAPFWRSSNNPTRKGAKLLDGNPCFTKNSERTKRNTRARRPCH